MGLSIDLAEDGLEFLDEDLALLGSHESDDALENTILVKLSFSKRLSLNGKVVQGLIK